MLGRRRRTIVYKLAIYGQALAIAMSAIVSASLKADTAGLSGIWAAFGPLLKWTQNWAWLLLGIASVYLALAEITRRIVGPPWVWEAIHHHLDLFQEYAFSDHPDAMLHEDRVTLFRYQKFRLCFRKWPWTGWLVPVERSGHTKRRRVAEFKVPDDADKAEGIAGAAWASKGTICVNDLPRLTMDSLEQDLRTYAEQTFVPIAWLRHYIGAGKSPAISFVGIPVEVKGKRWGVVVLDSQDEIRSSRTLLNLYSLFARMLVKLLEQA